MTEAIMEAFREGRPLTYLYRTDAFCGVWMTMHFEDAT